MTVEAPLPRAVQPFLDFAARLRAHRFAVAPDQTETFIRAVGLLGPRRMADIHQAALATLAPPPERRDAFDALFRLVFLGHTLAPPTAGEPDDDDEVEAFDERDGAMEPPEAAEEREVGAEATALEALAVRQFAPGEEAEALRAFARQAGRLLPRQLSHRRRTSHRGNRWHMRRLLRDAVRRDGEVLTLPLLARKTRQRRILLMLDVSGSMKEHTEAGLRFAHALAGVAERIEVFTVGTRLTRISRALRHRQRDQALAVASTLVADWDGGTRLGDALGAFLRVPRFASFARGSLVVVVSDGLERGEVTALETAVVALSRLAWRLVWLTPLAADTGYVPQTAALKAILPYLDHLGDGSRVDRLCGEVLAIARSAA